LRDLEVMNRDGLLDYDGSMLAVRPAGRLLIRNICMVFDRYLRGASEPAGRYSRVL
jgi:oxygen-independent coproporphyrinogen-3 oxidase